MTSEKEPQDKGKSHKNGLTADTVTAIAAVVIALFALILSVQEGCQNRHHNRLSVMPYISFDKETAYTSDEMGIFMSNEGLGTAIIQEMLLVIDGQEMPFHNDADCKAVLDKLNLDYLKVTYRYFSKNTPVSAGDRFKLLATRNANLDNDKKRRFIAILNRISVKAKYRSMYSEDFETKGIWPTKEAN